MLVQTTVNGTQPTLFPHILVIAHTQSEQAIPKKISLTAEMINIAFFSA